MEKKILAVIKKYSLAILLVLTVVWGISSLFKNRSLYDKFSVAAGQKKAVEADYIIYKKDAAERIKHLMQSIMEINKKTAALAEANDTKTTEIRKMRPSITQLEETRKVLSDKDAVIVNQDMQILQYKELVNKQEERYLEAKQIVGNLVEERNKAVQLAKEYHDLWQKELQLRKLSEDVVKELSAKYQSQKFKVTIKGIGEKVLFAGLGYGLGRLTDGK